MDEESLYLCPVCHDRYTLTAGRPCSSCLEQQMIDDAVPTPQSQTVKITIVKNTKTIEWIWVRQCAPRREMLKRNKQYFRDRGYDPDEIIARLQHKIETLLGRIRNMEEAQKGGWE